MTDMNDHFRRRKRAVISCALCRRRKIRCDRETPCSNCVRSKNTACIYEADVPTRMIPTALIQPRPSVPTIRNLSTSLTPNSTTSTASIELESMRQRIAELEDKLTHNSVSSPATTHSIHIMTSLSGPIDVLQDSAAFGNVHAIARGILHKNRVFGQSHWMNGFVVFHDLIEMLEPGFRNTTSDLLPGLLRAKMLARTIKDQRSPEWPTLPTHDLPPKSVCDKLVELYLGTMETLYRVLHVPTFRREYEAIWTGETKPGTPFTMQLKLVLAIGAIFHDENCSMRTEATRWTYEAQTWLSSPNFKSRLGIQYLQTSILLLFAREVVDVGSELVWISAGSLFREAIYIGLHKDPVSLPRMSVFESEMRRRIWNTILEANLQFSLISGGPSLVSMEDFNTAPPGNYDDEQLTSSDPQEMPDHVLTQTSLAIAFRQTLPIRLAITKFLNDVATTGNYEKTLRLDTAIRDSYKTLRRTLQAYTTADPTSSNFTIDAINFIMHRYISSLHIPYLNASLHEAAYAFSRKAVLDTSLKIWTLACPPNILPADFVEPNIMRLCRNGAGFFRAFTFHASSFLVVELRTQLQEEDSLPRPDLLNIPEDAANMVLKSINAGETGIKGFLLMHILAAQIEGIKQCLGKDEMTALLCQAGEEAVMRCIPLLEKSAGLDPGASDGSGVGDSDFHVSPDFMQDWDLIMSDAFNFDSAGTEDMEAFLM